MATFLELRTEVLTNLIDTPTSVQALVPTFVKRAIKSLQVKHNFKIMQQATGLVTTLLTRSAGSLPADWKEPRGRPRLVPFIPAKSKKLVYANFSVDNIPTIGEQDRGAPRVIVESGPSTVLGGSTFQIWPLPDGLSDYSDGEYRITVPYWKFLPELSADGETNWFTLNAEEWIIFTATADGFRVNEDETRMTFYKQLAAEKYREVVNRDKYAWIAGQETLAVHIDGTEDDTLAL